MLLALVLGCCGCSKIKQAFGTKQGEETAETEEIENDEPKEAEKAPEAKADKPKPKKKGIPEEVKRLAHQRRDAMMSKVKKYDRYPVTRQLVLDRYRIDLDDIFPDGKLDPDKFKSVSEVNDIIKTELKELTEFQFPESREQEVRKQAERMHPLYRVGDIVEVRHMRRNALVRGKLQAIYSDYMVIAGKRVLIEDLNSPRPVHFNPQAIRSRRELFIRSNFDDPRARYIKKTRQELIEKHYRRHGIVEYKGNWTSVKELIPTYIDPGVDRDERNYYAQKRREIQRQIAADLRKEGLLPPRKRRR